MLNYILVNMQMLKVKKSRVRACYVLLKLLHYGQQAGIKVNAGHGLNYHNVKPIAALPEIIELNIGHAIVARALVDGFATAVSEMKRLMIEGRNHSL